jgi:hypothetical protein
MKLPPTGLTSDILLIGTDGSSKLMISVKMSYPQKQQKFGMMGPNHPIKTSIT